MKRIKQVLKIAIGVICLGSFATAHADPMLSLAVGTLKLGTTNNEFLAGFGFNGNTGQEAAQIAFYSSSLYLTSAALPPIAQSSSPIFTFDYSFSVPSAATITQNATFATFVGSATSTVSLLQGANIIATATQTTPAFLGVNYSFPTITLLSGTQYDLVITTAGLPASFTGLAGGSQGFAQIALDVSAASTPEPSSLILLATGLLAIGGLAKTRNMRPAKVR